MITEKIKWPDSGDPYFDEKIAELLNRLTPGQLRDVLIFCHYRAFKIICDQRMYGY